MQPHGAPGYLNSLVAVTVGGTYLGGGPANYTGGTRYLFNARLRSSEFNQQRQDTTDSFFRDGVSGPENRSINLTLYYKGENYPPDFENYEYVLLDIIFGGTLIRRQVVLTDSFQQTGDVERAVEYSLKGQSDGEIFDA